MTKRYRRAFQIGLAALALWLVYQGAHYYRITHPNRNHAMTESLKEMQTFCVGRFLIDLPKGTTIIKAYGSGRHADFEAVHPVPHSEFESMTTQRWADISQKKADANGVPFLEAPSRTSPTRDAVIFSYGHTRVQSTDVTTGEDIEASVHEIEAHLWRDNILYSFTDHPLDQHVLETMRTLQHWRHDEIPSEHGFCGPRSFFAGGSQSESVLVGFRLPTQPPMELRLSTATFPAGEEYLRPRATRPNIKAFETDNFKSATHRDAERVVAGLPGEELLIGTTDRNGERYSTEILARWFYPGEPNSSGKPSIEAKVEISYETAEPTSPWGGFPPKQMPNEIGEDEFMTYWDTIVNSIRLRPGALPPESK